jgi:methylated-DNA-[protein]-cysteine S-methyltransferase
VTVKSGRLVGVDLPPTGTPAAPARPTAGAAPGEPVVGGRQNSEAAPEDRTALDRWVGELEAYFRGERLAWDAEEIGLADLQIGPFDRAVFATLLSVPPAATVSYGALAEMAGFPRAARAVGNAMASNPIPIVVPCHRVIRADGSLGNYGSDPAWKEWLLKHEADFVGPSERAFAGGGASTGRGASRGGGSGKARGSR